MVDQVGQVPIRLGDFETLRELARGGMGVVYEARFTRYSRFSHHFPATRGTRSWRRSSIKSRRHPERSPEVFQSTWKRFALRRSRGNPDRRYRTAEAFAKDLRNYVNRFAIAAKRTGPIGRVVKYARRNPVNSALIAVLLLMIVAGVFLGLHLRRVEEQKELARIHERAIEGILRGDSAARRCQEEAMEYGVDRYWLRFTDDQIELYQGDYKEAIQRLNEALKEQPDSIPDKSLLAVANLWGGNEPAYFLRLRKIEQESASEFALANLVAANIHDDLASEEKESKDRNENSSRESLDMAKEEAEYLNVETDLVDEFIWRWPSQHVVAGFDA